MREVGDRACKSRLENGRRVRAVTQAGAAVATAVIQGRMPSGMPRLMRMRGHGRAIEAHPVIGAVLHAGIARLGPRRDVMSKGERPRHAEPELQEQHGQKSPSSRAQSHEERIHPRFRTGKFRMERPHPGVDLSPRVPAIWV